MPKRTDIKSIMIIGAGPIVIGQACEFDYSGTQACKALREEGYRVVLVNSNPATIMTDPGLADATYVEPITPETVARIIAKEKPDALLPTMGGQTGLNTALALAKDGTLEAHGVELIGASMDAIDKAESRERFQEAASGARFGLHIRVVADLGVREGGFVVPHAVQDESMDPIAGPWVVRAQSFQDEYRSSQLCGPLGRPVHCEVPASATRRDHPVQDVLSAGTDGGGVLDQDSRARDHGAPLSSVERP